MKIEVAVLSVVATLSGAALADAAQPPVSTEAATIEHSLATAIRQAATDAGQRHLSSPAAQSLIEDAIRASVIQSGGEPPAVLSALANLPADLFTSDAVREAVKTVKADIAKLAAQSKDTESPGATGAPGQAPAILSAPPSSAGGGGGGGSDYRPG